MRSMVAAPPITPCKGSTGALVAAPEPARSLPLLEEKKESGASS